MLTEGSPTRVTFYRDSRILIRRKCLVLDLWQTHSSSVCSDVTVATTQTPTGTSTALSQPQLAPPRLQLYSIFGSGQP
uniref:Uncharacterized protein n=1 Tax=Echinococcus granulosus TaxID=6210 RepID=A0A068WH44_ECHGR|nr:hypothetical protein EgrG_000964300 [Echinococcus granulosus]